MVRAGGLVVSDGQDPIDIGGAKSAGYCLPGRKHAPHRSCGQDAHSGDSRRMSKPWADFDHFLTDFPPEHGFPTHRMMAGRQPDKPAAELGRRRRSRITVYPAVMSVKCGPIRRRNRGNRQFFEPRGCLGCRRTVAFRARNSARFSGVEFRNQPRWRNWQTRMIQVHVPVMGVEVRLLSGASKTGETNRESSGLSKVPGISAFVVTALPLPAMPLWAVFLRPTPGG